MDFDKQKKEIIETERFYHRAIKYLREEFPSKTKEIDNENLKKSIFSGCMRALDYGLESQEDAMAFVDLEWRFAKDFDLNEETSWAKDVLNDDDLDAKMKIETLRNAFITIEALKEDSDV